jgi:hypothetical protein
MSLNPIISALSKLDPYIPKATQLTKRTNHAFYSEAEKWRDKERLAAIDIQKNWRMLKVKWNYHKILKSCRLIQKVYRGYHKGRMIFFGETEKRNQHMQMAFFHEMAKIIQK